MSTLREKLKSKEYRDAFVRAHIETGVPFQVRAIREQRKMSQERLATLLGTSQPGVARIESPDRRLDLKTLMRVASAFDVALIVRFVPFSNLARWVENLSAETLTVPSFAEDHELAGKGVTQTFSVTTTRPDASVVVMLNTDTRSADTGVHVTKELLPVRRSRQPAITRFTAGARIANV